MRPLDYTLRWLKIQEDKRTIQLQHQIAEARKANRNQEIIRLCENLTRQAEQSHDHGVLGLAYAYLGETMRLMGPHHYEDALNAFGNARLHYSLDKPEPYGNLNKAIAYWSSAVVLDQMPDRWNDAARQYESALFHIKKLRQEAKERDLDKLTKELGVLQTLIEEDWNTLIRQQAIGDPKIESLIRLLTASEEQLRALTEKAVKGLSDTGDLLLGQTKELIEQTVSATDQSIRAAMEATQKAYFAVKSVGGIENAADSASRKFQAVEGAVHAVAQASAQALKAANTAHDASLRTVAAANQLKGTAEQIRDIGGRVTQLAAFSDSLPLLIVPITQATELQPGDCLAVQRNGGNRETLLQGQYAWETEKPEPPLYFFKRTAGDKIILVQGQDEIESKEGQEADKGKPIELPGQIIGILRKVG